MAKVLVVDDEPVVRELLRRSLVADGHTVIGAGDGAEALDKFRSEKPDLVFLDIKMPRMDGIEALQKIREADSEARVIMLTALDDVLLERAARQAGALDFLRKGIGFEAFMLVARRLLERRMKDGRTPAKPLGRILVVDDEPCVREMLERFLEGKGYEVETAAAGNEALEKARRYRPHVLIADVKMPELSGLELLQRLRETDPAMGIILITAYPDAIQDYPVLQKGAYDFILKPLNLEYLETSVLTKIIMMIA